MNSYIKVQWPKDSGYSVGFYHVDGDNDRWRSRWQEVKRFATEEEAANYVSYLNGGKLSNGQ